MGYMKAIQPKARITLHPAAQAAQLFLDMMSNTWSCNMNDLTDHTVSLQYVIDGVPTYATSVENDVHIRDVDMQTAFHPYAHAYGDCTKHRNETWHMSTCQNTRHTENNSTRIYD